MTRSYMRSFGGGEIAPLLFGRLDLAKNQTGLQKCENFVVTAQGPVESRPGFQYVQKVKTAGAVLIPFTYNSEQTFALEMGAGYIRFHTNGGTLLETAQAIVTLTVANPAVIEATGHGYSVGDWVQLASVGGMPSLSGRWGVVATVPDADHITLNDLWGNAFDTSALAAYTGAGTVARVYQIANPYSAAHLFDLHYVQSADVLTIVHPLFQARELRRVAATTWTLTSVSFVPTIAAPAAPAAVTGGPGGGTPINHTYVTTALAIGTLEESLASASAVANHDLTVAGNYVDVTSAAVAGTVRYNVYKLKGGIYGYIGQSSGAALRDENIEPDMSKTPPLTNNPFATDYPRAVSYHEQRRCLAGTALYPQSFWATRSGTESNLTYSIPSQDDDAIQARIVAREAQTIRHLVPLNDLLALTSGGVWRIQSSDGGALTPATFSVKPQSYVGASNVQPMVTGSSILYAPDRGSRIREVAYNWEAQAYRANDTAVLAPHLFDYQTIVQLAYATTPHQVLWAVRSDGVLLGLTYQPEHEVKAWHKHTAGGSGLFKSVCAVAEGDNDGLYAIVARTINGAAVQYIERLHTREFTDIEDAFFVDSGLTYDGAAATTISGLHHLEGLSVVALADGGVEPAQTVTDGAITLSSEASVVHVGLAYNCDFQTLPLALEAQGLGQGAVKNVNEAFLRVYQSSNVKMGPTFSAAALYTYPQRTQDDPYGSPPGLVSNMISMKLAPGWQQDGSLCVRQSDPLPLSILALGLDVAKGG